MTNWRLIRNWTNYFFRENDNQFSQADKLSLVLKRAEIIKHRNGNDGLYDLIRAILYPTMYRHLYDCLTAQDHQAPSVVKYQNIFPCSSYSEIPLPTNIQDSDKDKHLIDLSKDIVLTTPWHPDRICFHLGYIGHSVKFIEDSINHNVTIYYPLRVCIVVGGNHSIMQGILNGSGLLHAKTCCELYDQLKRYSYNGKHWIDHQDHSKLEVFNHDFGIAWEVAKLLDC